jgi:MFS family permease
VTGIPLGLLVDRVSRVRLLSVLVTIWSVFTGLCAFANSFVALVLMRVGIAAAESGSTPANLSLISDYFDRRRRSTAIGIYMMGSQLGTIVGFAFAGIIAAQYGWRAAFLMAGLPGLILVVLLLTTVREPRRGQSEEVVPAQPAPAPPIGVALRIIWAKPALVHMIAGLVIANTVAAGVSVWLPPLLMRNFGVSVKTAGFSIAFGVAGFAALASLFSGMLADRLDAKAPHTVPKLTALASLLVIPCIVYACSTHVYSLVIVGYALQTAVHMAINTPGYSLSLSLAPPQLRGTTGAVLQVLSNLLGYGLGPQLVGWLSDSFKPYMGIDSLRYAIGIFVFMNLWAVVHFIRAAHWLKHSNA